MLRRMHEAGTYLPSLRLPQHADKHRPECPVLLAVDQGDQSAGSPCGAGSRYAAEPLKELPSAALRTDLGWVRAALGRGETGVPSVPLALLPRGGA
jgi:hypothetical protein